jgi:tRNA G10  N-methylase Trm11
LAAIKEKMITIEKENIVKRELSEDLPQNLVDISDKKRSNLFTWRGQFSPQLIESLIQNYAKKGDVLYDPFCGSGTLLIEAAHNNYKSYGTELNPAAYGLASIYKLIPVNNNLIKTAISYVENIIVDYYPLNNHTEHPDPLSLLTTVACHS